MRTLTTWMLVLTISLSNAIMASANSAPASSVHFPNVALTADGCLSGQIVNEAGHPIANSEVTVRSQSDINQIASKVLTDQDGRFKIEGLKNGVCVLDAGAESYAVRVWQSRIAPPKALTSVALVSKADVVRGNDCKPSVGQRCANKVRCMSSAQKVGLGLLVAAAIIIPIAVSSDNGS